MKKVLALIIDSEQEIKDIKTIHALADYATSGGVDSTTIFYPAALKGRTDYIVNMAIETKMLDGYEYLLVVNGQSDIDVNKIIGLVESLEENNIDMIVPLSNFIDTVQHESINDKLEYYPFVDLNCFLIKVRVLIKVGGFEKKFCHITLPEKYSGNFYTTLKYWYVDFCVCLWQNSFVFGLTKKVKINLYNPYVREYSYIEETGGEDAVWYYRKLIYKDIKNCKEGKENIAYLLKNKKVEQYIQPIPPKLNNRDAADSNKLILLVFSVYLSVDKVYKGDEKHFVNMISMLKELAVRFKKHGYTLEFAREELIDEAHGYLFFRPQMNIFDVSNRVFEFAYMDKWLSVIKKNNLKEKSVLFATVEPPIHIPEFYEKKYFEPFGYVFTGVKKFVDNKKVFFSSPAFEMDLKFHDGMQCNQKKLIAFMSSYFTREMRDRSCLYIKRLELVNYFFENHQKEIDIYGYNWPKEKYQDSYKGIVDNKGRVFCNYKFIITIPNQVVSIDTMMDFRFFDAMVYGAVPIYVGCPDINDYIPKDVYIDLRRFENYDKLYEYLSCMSEEEYMGYINRIKTFMESPKVKRLNYDSIVKAISGVMDKM